MTAPRLCGAVAAIVAAASLAPQAHAATTLDDAAARLQALKLQVDEQLRRLTELQRALVEQEAGLEALRRSAASAPAAQSTASVAMPVQAAPPAPIGAVAAAGPESAGLALAPIFEQPGILTPAGRTVAEPSLQYAYASSNRIALVGYTVIPAVLVGLIDVREVKRSTFTAALTVRRGITNRFELEAKLPTVYRADSAVGREPLQGSAADSTFFDARGSGIGDAEATARWQLNAGGSDTPYLVASLRVKSRTGKDPFEIPVLTNERGFRGEGLQTELPTGSGFVGVQPGLSMIVPSDPAVLFGSVSWLHSVKRRNVSRTTDQGPEMLGTIAPGGIAGFNVGIGIALNEKSSFSLGYDHASVGRTRVNGQPAADAVRLQLGTLLLGYAHRLDERRSLNVSLGAGLTRDTPDVALTVRLPTTF